jgi:hypothetical protein
MRCHAGAAMHKTESAPSRSSAERGSAKNREIRGTASLVEGEASCFGVAAPPDLRVESNGTVLASSIARCSQELQLGLVGQRNRERFRLVEPGPGTFRAQPCRE